MKILVTGGAGFIGSHIVDRLISEGHEVSVIDNLSTGRIENLNRKAEFYKMDIVSPRIEKVFKKERPELICHLAAQMDVRKSVADPAYDAQTNIIGMLNLGEGGPIPTPETCPPGPVSPYGISKLTGERYLFFYKISYGLSYVALRYANVYGPRQDPFGEAGVVAIFAQKLLKNEQPVINGNGMQSRDYVYVDDVVDAVTSAIYSDISDILNVGTGIETSVNQLFRLLVEITGSPAREVYGPAMKGEQARSCLSYDKIKKALEWEPRIPLQEGLSRTVAFFRDRQ